MAEAQRESEADVDAMRCMLEESADVCRAIMGGEVDAFVVGAEDGNRRVLLLATAYQRYRQLVERMAQGAVTVTAQGNILAGEAVVVGMVDAFEKTTGHLSLRLMAALDAGQAAGGDSRGMQSAAMLIVKKNGGVWLNNDVVLRLQVDDNPEPIVELRRLVERAARQRRP